MTELRIEEAPERPEGAVFAGPDAGKGESLWLVGWLLPADLERVRLILGDVYADFSVHDVRSVTVLPSWQPARDEVSPYVKVEFKQSPTILSMGPSAPLRSFFRPGPRPFALATRRTPPQLEGREDYKRREAAYLRAKGIVL